MVQASINHAALKSNERVTYNTLVTRFFSLQTGSDPANGVGHRKELVINRSTGSPSIAARVDRF